MRPMTTFMLVLFLSASAVSAAEVPADVRANVARRVDRGSAVGAVIALIDSTGTTFWSHGSKTLEVSPVSETTVFEIGSVTKVFTSLALAGMVNEGLVTLDDAAASLMPAGAAVPSRNGAEITLGSLAYHRSGLPRLPDNLAPADPENPYAGYGEAQLLAFLAVYALPRDVGAEYEYSNFGTGYLGYLLARKAGVSFEEMIRARILDPLGMKDTGITPTADQEARMATGHDNGRPAKNWDFDALAGAGALRSTAADMARFVRAAMGLDVTPLARDFALMLEDRKEMGVATMKVGVGWHIQNSAGTTAVWHNGGTGGFRSFIGFRPATNTGVVVLTNSTESMDDVGFHLLDAQYPLDEPKVIVTVAPTVLDGYVGYYELAPGVMVHITRDGAQLMAQVTGQGRVPIFADSDSTFFYKVVDARVEFRRGAGDRVDRLILDQNGQHPAVRRDDYVPPTRTEIAVSPEILRTYAGRYQLQPGVMFDVRLEGSQLTAKLTGQPAYPVFPESETLFFYKVVEAQLEFRKDDSGAVTGVVLHQGGISQPAERVGD